MITQDNRELSLTPEQFAFLLHANGLYLITNDMLERCPTLANCRVADGFPCLSSAALWCLYCLTYGAEQNRKLLRRLAVRILISFPEISEATKRALEFYGNYSQETYDGLMEISKSNTFLVDVAIVTQWLLAELTMSDKCECPTDIFQEMASQINCLFNRLPDPNMIHFESPASK